MKEDFRTAPPCLLRAPISYDYEEAVLQLELNKTPWARDQRLLIRRAPAETLIVECCSVIILRTRLEFHRKSPVQHESRGSERDDAHITRRITDKQAQAQAVSVPGSSRNKEVRAPWR